MIQQLDVVATSELGVDARSRDGAFQVLAPPHLLLHHQHQHPHRHRFGIYFPSSLSQHHRFNSLSWISNLIQSSYSLECKSSTLDAPFDLHSWHPALQKFLRHATQRHPFHTFMLVDVLNDPAEISVRRAACCVRDSPLVHQDDLRLPANLWMDAHGKDERVILSVCKVELLHP